MDEDETILTPVRNLVLWEGGKPPLIRTMTNNITLNSGSRFSVWCSLDFKSAGLAERSSGFVLAADYDWNFT
jgi:hypothetical protein